ncbi:MAG TPA: HD domain-containing protein [Methanosarcinales archaeon]|nr:HD domain-containing protein [Methanosarcinales archaeon]
MALNVFNLIFLKSAKTDSDISIFEHGVDTYHVLNYFINQNRALVSKEDINILKLSALLHDIGKIKQDIKDDQWIHAPYSQEYISELINNPRFCELLNYYNIKIPENDYGIDLLLKLCKQHHNPSSSLLQICPSSILLEIADIIASSIEDGMTGNIKKILKNNTNTKILQNFENLCFNGIEGEIHKIEFPNPYIRDVLLSHLIFQILREKLAENNIKILMQKYSTLWIIGDKKVIIKILQNFKIHSVQIFDKLLETQSIGGVYEKILYSELKKYANFNEENISLFFSIYPILKKVCTIQNTEKRQQSMVSVIPPPSLLSNKKDIMELAKLFKAISSAFKEYHNILQVVLKLEKYVLFDGIPITKSSIKNSNICPICKLYNKEKNSSTCKWCFIANYISILFQEVTKEGDYLYIATPLPKKVIKNKIPKKTKVNFVLNFQDFNSIIGIYISYASIIGSEPQNTQITYPVKKNLIIALFHKFYGLFLGNLHYGKITQNISKFSIFGESISLDEIQKSSIIYKICNKYARYGEYRVLDIDIFMHFFKNPRHALNLIFRKLLQSNLENENIKEMINLVEKELVDDDLDWIFKLGLELTEKLVQLGLIDGIESKDCTSVPNSPLDSLTNLCFAKVDAHYRPLSARNWTNRVLMESHNINESTLKEILKLTEKILKTCKEHNTSLKEFSKKIADMDLYLLYYYNLLL